MTDPLPPIVGIDPPAPVPFQPVPIVAQPGTASSTFLMVLLQSILPAVATMCGLLMDILPNFGTPAAAQTLVIVGITAKVLLAMGYSVHRQSVTNTVANANAAVQTAAINATKA